MKQLFAKFLVLCMVLNMIPASVVAMDAVEEPAEIVEAVPGEAAEAEEVEAPEETVEPEAAEEPAEAPEEELEAVESAVPEEELAAASGKCGDDVTWTLDDNRNLIVRYNQSIVYNTSPEMYDYNYGESPWGMNITSATVYGSGIGTYAFAGSTVQSATFYGNHGIMDHAFEDCKSLKTVTFLPGTSVDSGAISWIGERAFAGSGLTHFSAPDINGPIGNVDGVKASGHISKGAFEGCHDLKEVEIPKGIGKICYSVFADCTSLTTVTLPSTLSRIERGAFEGCTKLTKLMIPESVIGIGDDAFANIQPSSTKCILYFAGDAPTFEETVFSGTTATVYYPKSNITWTSSVRKNYGGNITWIAYDGSPEGYKRGWEKENGYWRYYENNQYVIGWKKIDGIWYYFDTKGYMVTGLQKIGEKWYYFDSDGSMISNRWMKISGRWYYFTSNGSNASGWTEVGGNLYYFDPAQDDLMLTNGWYITDGAMRALFDENGVCVFRQAWLGDDLSWDLDANGKLTISGTGAIRHYAMQFLAMDLYLKMDQHVSSVVIGKGVTAIGAYAFQQDDMAKMANIDIREIYFEGNAPKIDATAFKGITAKVYYPKGNSTWTAAKRQNYGGKLTWVAYDPAPPKQGWMQENGSWYYYENGKPVTGWKYVDGGWYHFNANGVMQIGWVSDGGKWYFMNGSGAMVAKDWVSDGGKWYYMNGSGAMVAKDWVSSDGKWYYMNGSGAMVAKDWVSDGGKWYYMNGSGAMVAKEWVSSGSKWYYMGSSGSMYVNAWVSSGGKWYYMDGDGVMVANVTLTIGGKEYSFDGNGVCLNP